MKSLKLIFVFIWGVFFLSPALPSFAQDSSVGDYVAGASYKLGRGLENIISSPAELPCVVSEHVEERKNVFGFLAGVGKGALSIVRRALVGVTEVGTFLLPEEATIARVCAEDPVGVVG